MCHVPYFAVPVFRVWLSEGSAATGIPIGALVVASPLQISAYFCAGGYEDDTKDAYGDGEVIGKLQVKFEVLLPFLFLFFPLFTKNCFSVFFWDRKKK